MCIEYMCARARDLALRGAFIIFPQTDMIYGIDKRDDFAVKYVAFLSAAFISSFRTKIGLREM